METSSNVNVGVVCGFNTRELPSILYDLVHLSIILKHMLHYSNIYILCDDVDGFQNVMNTEWVRLSGRLNLSEIRDQPLVINISNKKDYFKSLNSIVSQYNGPTSLFYTLSSHGYTGLKSYNGSESDGIDEYIRVGGEIILDNELSQFFLNLPGNFNTFAIIDTCSSGTMLDLPYVKNLKTGQIITENKKTFKNNICMMSACLDGEYDSDNISGLGFGGGLTSVFIDYVLNNMPDDLHIYDIAKYVGEKLTTVTPLLSSSRRENIEK